MIPRSGFSSAIALCPDDLKNFKGLDDRKEVVQWPCLNRAPERLQYLLDLYADQKRAHVDVEDEMWTVKAAAILVIEGSARVVDDKGNTIEKLAQGQCYDYHFMLDLPDGEPITYLMPEKDCKVKLVTKEIWDKVLAEFPAEEAPCKDLIREYSVQRAQEKLGFQPGSIETLCMSAVFRALSEGVVLRMVRYLQNRLYIKGSKLTEPGQAEQGMYILLGGNV